MILGIIILLVIVIYWFIFEKGGRTPIQEKRGKEGEETCTQRLSRLLEDDEYLLTNLLIPTGRDRKTEIDAVLISRKGAFCIEIKNWVGHISGKQEDEYWWQQYDDPRKQDKKHRNPYLQNEKHCDKLDKIFKGKYKFGNIVLFPQIEDRSNLYSDATFDLNEFIRSYRRLEKTSLKYHQIKEIYERLKIYQPTEEELKEFKQQISMKYKND